MTRPRIEPGSPVPWQTPYTLGQWAGIFSKYLDIIVCARVVPVKLESFVSCKLIKSLIGEKEKKKQNKWDET